MGKLSDWLKGTRAIKRVPLPLVNVPSEYSEDQPELAQQREKDRAEAESSTPPGSNPAGAIRVPEVGLRVLTGMEQAEVLKRSRAYSLANGGNPDSPGDVLQAFALQAYTVAIAAIDPDSDPKNPEPFAGNRGDIESGFRALLSSVHIGRDGIQYLFEAQELWQDQCSPQTLNVPPEKFWKTIEEMGTSEDADPFLRLRPGMRFKLMQFSASLLLTLPELSSRFSSGLSAETTENSEPA